MEPQHFQLQDLRRRPDLEYLIANLRPNAWGLTSLAINETPLLSGLFEVTNLDMWLPDGRRLLFPGNADLRAADFRADWTNHEERLTAYLAVPHFHLSGDNLNQKALRSPDSSRAAGPGRSVPRGLYNESLEPELIPDLIGRGPAGRVETLSCAVRLVFGEAAKDADREALAIPIAKLEREGEAVKLSKTFAPPSLAMNQEHPVRAILKDVLDILQASGGRLDDYRVDPGQYHREGFGGRGHMLMTILGILGRHVPVFHLMLNSPVLHPYNAYEAMSRLYGELGVFARRGADVGAGRSTFTPPPYNHEDCREAFEIMAMVVARLLEAVAIGPELSLAFEREGELFRLSLPSEVEASTACWLTVRSELAPERAIELVSRDARLGTRGRIGGLIAHALPGVRLQAVKSAPAGFRQRPDTVWFSIEQDDPLWAESVNAREIAVFWDTAPETASLTMVAERV